ncbi:LapA family protein [Candidatus Photodesmus blepharus]|uniref:LapA family protein n=1 Tax=Candidatus Photodesmus blepharonis TaxID=1179155 RepID=UPI000555067F|nr:lipopolysaccharide assembly protein LapA domain-containing protein [Candidatus Photodesmus blepharus]
MKIVKVLLIFALFFIALALGSQNRSIVTFNYLFSKREFHLSFLLGFVFTVGFLLACLILGCSHLKSQFRIRKLSKQLKKIAINKNSYKVRV